MIIKFIYNHKDSDYYNYSGMVKINDNPDSVEEATKESESSGTNKYAIRERNFSHFFDKKRKFIPKNIEDLLFENGFIRKESDYGEDSYTRNYNGRREVLLYDDSNMMLARIPRWKKVGYGIKRIRGYKDGKEPSLLEKWLTPFIWTALFMGPLVIFGKAVIVRDTLNYENVVFGVLESFSEGGLIGAAMWRSVWYIYNKRTFKEGKEVLEYINGK